MGLVCAGVQEQLSISRSVVEPICPQARGHQVRQEDLSLFSRKRSIVQHKPGVVRARQVPASMLGWRWPLLTNGHAPQTKVQQSDPESTRADLLHTPALTWNMMARNTQERKEVLDSFQDAEFQTLTATRHRISRLRACAAHCIGVLNIAEKRRRPQAVLCTTSPFQHKESVPWRVCISYRYCMCAAL